MDDDSKSIFLTKTFWGIVLAALGHMGFFTWAAQHLGTPVPTDYNLLANSIIGGIGDLIAIYGRLKATQPAHLVTAPTMPPSPLQSGMAHPAFLVWITCMIVAGLVMGCAALGVPTPQTFNQQEAVAITTVTTVRTTTTTLLQAGKITAADAQNVEDQADTARTGINLAAADADLQGATDKLAAALQILTTLQTYLATKGN